MFEVSDRAKFPMAQGLRRRGISDTVRFPLARSLQRRDISGNAKFPAAQNAIQDGAHGKVI